MERSFGSTFAEVRVHADAAAARVSDDLGARAFTVGDDIAFAAGQYQPGTSRGERLIAHELAHTIQQRGGTLDPAHSSEHDLERQADRAAAAVAWGSGATAAVPAGQVGRTVQLLPLALVGALEIGADAVVITEVGAVSTEVVLVDGAIVTTTEVAAPLVTETVAPVLTESVAPAALESLAPTVAPTLTTAATTSSATASTLIGAGLAATTLSGDQPEESEPQRNCLEQNPSALICTEGIEREEVVQEFLMNQGYDFDALGDCYGMASFGVGAIDACDGAPGVRWHCRVNGTPKEVSIFGCLCCKPDGSTGFEWRGPHWSVNLSSRGR